MAEDTMLMCYDDHANILLHSLQDLYQRQLLTDVVLVVEDTEFTAHITVLVSYSQYFKNMLDTTPFYNDQHHLKNTTVASMKVLLDFMYSGALCLNPSSVLEVLASASHLRIPKAVELCQEYLTCNMNAEGANPRKGLQLRQVLDATHSEMDTKTQPVSLVCGLTPTAVISKDVHLPNIKQEHLEVAADLRGHDIARNFEAAPTTANDSERLPSCEATLTSIKDPHQSSRKRSISAARRNSKSKRKGTPPKVIVTTVRGMKDNATSLRKAYCCALCPQKYQFFSLLHLHRKQHQLQSSHFLAKSKVKRSIEFSWRWQRLKVPHQCGVSKSKFSHSSNYQMHYHKQHSLHLRCNSCCSQFLTISSLWSHLQIKHQRNFRWTSPTTSKCPQCLKVFLHSGNLAKHIAVAHTEVSQLPRKQILVCKICEKQYVSLKPFKKHLANHGRSQREVEKEVLSLTAQALPAKTTCSKCGQDFPSLCQLQQHVCRTVKPPVSCHAGKRKRRSLKGQQTAAWMRKLKWSCHECSQRCCTYKDMRQHMQEMHPLILLPCPRCPFQTQIKKVLERHIKDKHESSDTGRVCEICGKTFPKKYHLKFHRFSKHNITDPSIKILKCEQLGCEYTTLSTSSLRKHSEKHSSDKPFRCNICGKLLKTERNLQLHINKTHANIRPYICDQCGASYGQESELKTHMVRHGLVKQYQCQHCDYASHDKDNYRHHLYALHKVKLYEQMKIFQCNICDFNTTLKYRYNNHMKVHMNIRDLPCPECGKLFMTKNAMRQHIVKVHKPKVFQCDCCSYATAERSKLVDHMRIIHTHRNYKPYKCAYCDFVCATSGNCRKHVMQRHRGMQVQYVKLAQRTPADFNVASIQPARPASPTSMAQRESDDVTPGAGMAVQHFSTDSEAVMALPVQVQAVEPAGPEDMVAIMQTPQLQTSWQMH